MLDEFGPGIWIADGPEVVAMLGFHYPTRMAVIRLDDGGLVVWSPVALTDALRSEVATLGQVHHLVAPNSLHHLFIGEWKEAWPEAKLYAAPGLREKREDLAIEVELGDGSVYDWSGEVEHVLVQGNAITTEAVFFHRRSGAVLFTDLIQQLPAGWFSGWRAVVARLDLMLGPAPAVPRKFRAAFTDRHAARASLERILAWPAEKVLMAHGAPVTTGGQAFLKRAFAWLLR